MSTCTARHSAMNQAIFEVLESRQLLSVTLEGNSATFDAVPEEYVFLARYDTIPVAQSNVVKVGHNQSFTKVLGTFTGDGVAGDYVATIDWGDGTTSAGVVRSGWKV